MPGRRLPFQLALADTLYERRFFLLSAIGLAAVLAPLLVLLSLKYGVIDILLTRLLDDPANREIRLTLHGDYDEAFLTELAARPDVAFLVPQVRSLSASVLLAVLDSQPQISAQAELLPTAPGDPLLPAAVQPLPQLGIALSRDLAERLDRKPGDSLRLILNRQKGGREERVFLDLTVAAVAERSGLTGRMALVPLPLLLALEDYRDDVAVPAFGWEGSRPPPGPGQRHYSRFRLYAASLEQVQPLADHLAALGIDTRTNAAAIENVVAMNESLSRIFAIVAALGGAGYLGTLAVSLWTNVERKRRTQSVLRLMGLTPGALALFPMIQAAMIALAGFLLALALFHLAALVINRLFADGLIAGEALAYLPVEYLAAAAGVTLLVALAAAAYAALRAARIDPAEGLRDV